jgi:hypothetical protein
MSMPLSNFNGSVSPTVTGNYAFIFTYKGGCSDTTECKSITITPNTNGQNEIILSNTILVYPNPNSGTFTIQGTKGGVFELIDVTGKVINTYTITNTQQTINENIPAGMYFVREKESGTIQKLIVQ